MNCPTAQTFNKRTPTANKVLESYPDAKDNYAYFIALCWQEDGFLNLSPIELEAFRFAPSPESYSRILRKKVEKKEIVLSKERQASNRILASHTRKEIKTVDIKRPIRYEFDNETNTAKEVYA